MAFSLAYSAQTNTLFVGGMDALIHPFNINPISKNTRPLKPIGIRSMIWWFWILIHGWQVQVGIKV